MSRGPLAARNRRLARARLAACARMWIRVLDDLALYGQEDDDRPRMWLAEMERFARGEQVSIPADANAALEEYVTRAADHGKIVPTECPVRGALRRGLSDTADVRRDVMAHPTHVGARLRHATLFAARVLCATGRETVESGYHKCVQWMAQATKDVCEEMATDTLRMEVTT